MRFGLTLAPFDRFGSVDELVRAAQAAERSGLDYVSLPDHLIVPEGPEQPRSGVVFPDVFVLGALLAGATTNTTIAFTALVVPLREPIALAKQIATLDWVSKGRLIVVVGSGWLRSEFDAVGVGFDDRGDRTDEYLRCLKTCWTEARPAFEGKYVSFPPSAVEPKCVQVPHVPLWIGGNGPRPERRVVELGDGWAPLTGTFDERAAAITRLKQRIAEAGRDADAMAFAGNLMVGELDAATLRLQRGHHVTERDHDDATRRRAVTADAAIDEIGRAAEAGFTHLNLTIGWEDVAELEDKLEWLAGNVLSEAVARTGGTDG
jgi:probable F420-dependent oxidoreductase